MKRLLHLIVVFTFVTTVLTAAGCGQVKEEPTDTSGSDQQKSISEQREETSGANTENLSEEKVVEESNADTLVKLAELETGWSNELHQLVVESDELTDQWLYGDMVYNSYIMELFKMKQRFDRFYETCETVYVENGFAENLKDEPKYTKGLIYGHQMRETVREFFDATYGTGKESTGGEKIDVSGEEFEQFYIDKLVKEYNDNYRKLSMALNDF